MASLKLPSNNCSSPTFLTLQISTSCYFVVGFVQRLDADQHLKTVALFLHPGEIINPNTNLLDATTSTVLLILTKLFTML